MKQLVVSRRSALASLTGLMACAVLLFGACDNPTSSDGAPEDGVISEDDEDEVTPSLYSIIYLGNGEVSGEPPFDTAEYSGGQTIRIAAQGDLRGALIRDGITQCVTHWTTGEDGSGDDYVPGTTAYMPDHDLTLYAQWSTDSEVIGKTGPSGGWIFYEDAGDLNWAYLEAAPTDIVIDGREEWQWGAWDHDIAGIVDAIGSGLGDTLTIVVFHDSLSSTDGSASSYYEYTGDFGAIDGFSDGNVAGPQSYTFSSNNDGTVAAKLCMEYTVEFEGMPYEEWFLPSEAELAEMYTNLRDRPRPLGAFDLHRTYWSTNGLTAGNARARDFQDGSEVAGLKSSSYRVRPVRRF